jgi:succinate dehydrogenase / fumarate reductase membrane anchor subunit
VSRKAHGLRAWVLQRISAVYLAVYFVTAGGFLLKQPSMTYAQWRSWIADPWINLATGLFILSLLVHAWVGIRNIVMDYVPHSGLRISLFAIVGLTLAGCGIWSIRVLFYAAS